MSVTPIPPITISHAAHEWRMLFVLLEYFEGLPSNAARELWLDRLHVLRPSLFDSLLQLLQLRERADACGFLRTPPIVSDRVPWPPKLGWHVDDVRRRSHGDV